ncbi:MAG: plasma-membrane proton-efflux P-type ATPase [Caldilineales bacterium]
MTSATHLNTHRTPARKPASNKQAADSKKPDLPLPALKQQLGFSPDGLSAAEVGRRREQYGYNELVEEKTSPLRRFLTYFWGPIPWMIEVAAILSAVVRHWADFAIILALLLLNAAVGFWEEYQAGNTIAALKAQLALQAKVKRDGKWQVLPARELVPGDLIRLRLGDIVPADCRLLDEDPVQVDQSALTGESLPVSHGNGDAVYSGSVIKQGESDALVYATGSETFFGKTASLVETAHTVSHFQKAVLKIGDYLIVLALSLVILILAVALFRGDAMLTTLQFALVLTVAAVPVAMPAVLSVTMAVGAKTLARNQAVVSRLASIEEMAGMDVLCSDKTGTLTQNKLTLGDPFVVPGENSRQLFLCAALASRAEDNDTIDLAVLGGLPDGQLTDGYKVVHFQPFDPVSKRTEAAVQAPDGSTIRVSKGAPQVILALAGQGNAARVRPVVEQTVTELAERGFRALGVARSSDGTHWDFLGVLPLYDPPREDSKATLAAARELGVGVKMITGDQLAIGKEIARELDIGADILDAGLFGDTSHTQASQLAERIEDADGFAQVYPEHKFLIVDTLQQRGHIVGMTGDGVNDAPALKKADVGVAVTGATDAARSAADIVLLTPGLTVIVDAIKESRKIFQRMNSYAMYRIAETIRVLLFMSLSIMVFNFYPVTTVMIVLLALLNDAAILTIAYDNVEYAAQPEAWDMRRVLGIATVLGVTGLIASFGLFYLAERVFHLNQDTIQTMMYLKLSLAGHLTIFVTRTRGPFWSSRPANLLTGAVLGTQTVATLFAVFGIFMAPIGWQLALLVWAYAIAWFLVNDRVKLLAYRILDSNKPSLLMRTA